MTQLPLRAQLAIALGRTAATLSRADRARRRIGDRRPGRRSSSTPTCSRQLAADRRLVLVSATNGKTTTTRLIAAALRRARRGRLQRASAPTCPPGIASALAGRPDARYGVLEVDEKYLRRVARRRPAPEVIALLNLSRDQMDRAAEIRHARREVARGARRLRGPM